MARPWEEIEDRQSPEVKALSEKYYNELAHTIMLMRHSGTVGNSIQLHPEVTWQRLIALLDATERSALLDRRAADDIEERIRAARTAHAAAGYVEDSPEIEQMVQERNAQIEPRSAAPDGESVMELAKRIHTFLQGGYTIGKLRTAIEQLRLTVSDASSATSEAVAREPTKEMRLAGEHLLGRVPDICAADLWRAMWDAAQPPTPNQHTHADQCWTWGPKHYECALERIRVLESAPSPTAALGKLAKALNDHADVLTKVCGDCYTDQEGIDKAIPLMRRAAAKLSGVAAQGDGVPKGWTITPQDDAILVRGPGGDAYLSDEKHNSPVSVIVLFRLAKALLAAQVDDEQFSEDEEKEWADITKGLPVAPYAHPTFREAEIAVLTGKWPSREPQRQSIVKQGDGEERVSEDKGDDHV